MASATGTAVYVDDKGHLGNVVSSARYKANIKPMNKASEAILELEPVTFRYKQDLDPDGIPQFGLIAEQVEKIDPDLVIRDEDGKVSTVRYEAVNAMLLNEFLKEHRKVPDLRSQDRAATKRVSGKAFPARRSFSIETCAPAEANRSAYCGPAEGEQSSRTDQTCAAGGRQPPLTIIAKRQ